MAGTGDKDAIHQVAVQSKMRKGLNKFLNALPEEHRKTYWEEEDAKRAAVER